LKDLSPGQEQTLDFIVAYREANYYLPTIEELANHFGISITAARDRLLGLERKGRVELREGSPRAIKVLKQKSDVVKV
jgi:repressor LexA